MDTHIYGHTNTHTNTQLLNHLRINYTHYSLKPWVFWHTFLKDRDRQTLSDRPRALPRRILAVTLLTCGSVFSHCPNAVSYGLYVLFNLALKILLMAFSCIVWKGFSVSCELAFFSSYREGWLLYVRAVLFLFFSTVHYVRRFMTPANPMIGHNEFWWSVYHGSCWAFLWEIMLFSL